MSWWCHPTIHLILCHPLLFLPSIFPGIRVFSNELFLHTRWPKYWSFSFSISLSSSMLISFRIDWFDLLAVQGTLRSLLQHHNLKVLSTGSEDYSSLLLWSWACPCDLFWPMRCGWQCLVLLPWKALLESDCSIFPGPTLWGFPGGSVLKNLSASAGDTGDVGLIPGSGRFPWSRKWQLTPVFLPGKFHVQGRLVGYSPWITKSWIRLNDWATLYCQCRHGEERILFYLLFGHATWHVGS